MEIWLLSFILQKKKKICRKKSLKIQEYKSAIDESIFLIGEKDNKKSASIA